MAVTTNLDITLMDALQAAKSDTANAAINRLEDVLTEMFTKAMTTDYTMTDSEWIECAHIRCTGAVPGGGATLTVPARKKQAIIEHAGTGGNVTIKTAAGSGVVVALGALALVRCDGTNVIGITQATSVYDLGGSVAGLPGTGATIFRFVAVRSFTLPASLTGSRAISQVAATGSSTFDLKKNGAAAFGTFNFAGAATTATFSAASSTSFAAGDILTVVAPNPQDATLADIDFTFAGSR